MIGEELDENAEAVRRYSDGTISVERLGTRLQFAAYERHGPEVIGVHRGAEPFGLERVRAIYSALYKTQARAAEPPSARDREELARRLRAVQP